MTESHLGLRFLGASANDVRGISFSGETVEVAELIEIANKKGLTTISITKYGSNLCSNLAKIPLYTTAKKEATYRSGATSSRIAQLHVIDILFMCVVSKTYDETIQFIDESRNAVAELKSLQKKRK